MPLNRTVDVLAILNVIESAERDAGLINVHLPLEDRIKQLIDYLTDADYETERVEADRYIDRLEKQNEAYADLLRSTVDNLAVFGKSLEHKLDRMA